MSKEKAIQKLKSTRDKLNIIESKLNTAEIRLEAAMIKRDAAERLIDKALAELEEEEDPPKLAVRGNHIYFRNGGTVP